MENRQTDERITDSFLDAEFQSDAVTYFIIFLPLGMNRSTVFRISNHHQCFCSTTTARTSLLTPLPLTGTPFLAPFLQQYLWFYLCCNNRQSRLLCRRCPPIFFGFNSLWFYQSFLPPSRNRSSSSHPETCPTPLQEQASSRHPIWA